MAIARIKALKVAPIITAPGFDPPRFMRIVLYSNRGAWPTIAANQDSLRIATSALTPTLAMRIVFNGNPAVMFQSLEGILAHCDRISRW